MPTKYQQCTTFSVKRLHLSADLVLWSSIGRSGRTLCNNRAYDQRYVDHFDKQSSNPKQIIIADLPPCSLCARRAGPQEDPSA